MSWETWLGLALAVFGVVISVWSWLRPRRLHPLPRWRTVHAIPLVREQVKGLEELRITYKDVELTRLTAWTGKLWNAGKSPIRHADLRPNCLTFRFPAARVLTVVLGRVSRPEIEFTVAPGGARTDAAATFEFLDFKDGGEITVFHDGEPSLEPHLLGAVIGAKVEKVYSRGHKPEEHPRFGPFMYIWMILTTAVVVLIGQTVQSRGLYPDATLGETVRLVFGGVQGWGFGIVAAAWLGLGIYIYLSSYQSYLASKVEPFFESSEDNVF